MSHLTSEQRYTIASMYQEGYSQIAIAKTIGRDKSVISRELKRNCDKRSGEYRFTLAEKKYKARQQAKTKRKYFTPAIEAYVCQGLMRNLSPEQIVGLAKREGRACVSHERIYQYIWADKKAGGTLYTHLRSQGKRYRKRGANKDKRGQIPRRISIDKRPAIVEEKKRFGDLEIDTIIGKNHKGAILTINDRVTGLVKIRKLKSKNAEELAQATCQALKEWKPYLHTITADNGKEFTAHEKIAKELNIDFFFAHPYHSWERGANENLNGLIRQYIPKKTDFEQIEADFLQQVEDQLNQRPRKRHNFLSPNQVFKMKKVVFVT